MTDEDTIEERQENELEALKAIYGDDVRDLRKKAVWNKWQPLHISLTLYPPQGNSGSHEVHANVDLHVTCSENYPNDVPDIKLEKSRGLSDSVLSELQLKLNEMAQMRKGEVMIYELAGCVITWLDTYNKPGVKSFYDEMVKRNKENEMLAQEAQKIEKDRERQNMLNELQRKQEILRMKESRLQKEEKILIENLNENIQETKRNSISNGRRQCFTSEDDRISCEHTGIKTIEFAINGPRIIQRGKCVAHSNRKCVLFSGIDDKSGEMVVLSEWNVKAAPDTSLPTLQRQLSSLEQEINYLVKLRHQNLSHYLSMKYDYNNDEDVVVYILREFIYGTNCKELFISQKLPVEMDMLRHIITGVLSALEFLHRNNVVHKELCSSCVYLSKKGVVKVANYSIDKRLFDLTSHTHSSCYSKKTDIYNLGVLILSLMRGSLIIEDVTEIPDMFSNDLQDFLTKCLAREEKHRYTAQQLLNHAFLRQPLERQSPQRNVEVPNVLEDHSMEQQSIDLKLSHLCQLGQSRVESEFDILHCVGKGAFGEVFKVQNKLDRGIYALKRIKLNPKSRQLNKKIISEVKLLSRLKHENVVRYYNSWIETANIKNDELGSNTDSSTSKIVQENVNVLSFKTDSNIAPTGTKYVEWSVSKEGNSKSVAQDDEFSSSDEDDDDAFQLKFDKNDEFESESVIFEEEKDDTKEDLSSSKSIPVSDEISTPYEIEIQYMYIQMEFCEKSTLRSVINAGLYLEKDRGWRLFREIVDGLAHIHQQGMIHRDLKPVNIFLDLNDHVKIGDFGLATTNLLSRPNECASVNKSYSDVHQENIDVSLTGQVGTALYVAPELMSTPKANYNRKVDIYSLGIIFFEMCYKPPETGMERVILLNNLRSKDIIFPKDFNNHKQEFVIRWLLCHDAAQRPTSQELLQSEHVPPPMLEEFELQELIRYMLSNPQLKAYKYLVSSCFKQQSLSVDDILYDSEQSVSTAYKHIQSYDYVRNSIVKIFQLHGGQHLSTPLLMPKTDYYKNVETCVKVMTRSGRIVSIPHDLRVPFARYVAWNGIALLRRFSTERVYREKKVFDYIPRELYECAFDIVTPTPGSFINDAELFYMLKQIKDDLLDLNDKNFTIRLNHTSLSRAILLYFGIKEKHDDIYDMLDGVREEKVAMFHVRAHLTGLGLSENNISTLLGFMESEQSIDKIVNQLQMITKKKSSEASDLAKKALEELKLIVQNIETFDIGFNIVITPGLTNNIRQYSGMMFQLVCNIKKHKRGFMDVLAVGGRYDDMISTYRATLENADTLSKDIRQSAVGVTVFLDKLVQAFIKKQRTDKTYSKMGSSHLQAMVYFVGSKISLDDKGQILKELWKAEIKSSVIEINSIEENIEIYPDYNIPLLITLRDTDEKGTVRIQYWDKERLQEKKINKNDLMTHIQQNVPQYLTRMNSKTSMSDHGEQQHNHDATVNIQFISNEKLSSNIRKRHENQIRSQLNNVCRKLTGEVCILALNVDSDIVRTLASYLDLENDSQYDKSVAIVIEKHLRHKKYLINICDEIGRLKSEKSKPIIILYSLNESFYKILL